MYIYVYMLIEDEVEWGSDSSLTEEKRNVLYVCISIYMCISMYV
jgi:hypothetical protein